MSQWPIKYQDFGAVVTNTVFPETTQLHKIGIFTGYARCETALFGKRGWICANDLF